MRRLLVILTLTTMVFSGTNVLAQDAGRFELGGQFSLLSRNRPSTQFDTGFKFDDFDDFFPQRVNKLGLGARFTYNLTKKIALEAVGNFFPERNFVFGVPEGQIYQGQFGVKAGKRCRKFGFFGKFRPGFVTFTKVSQFTGFEEVSVFDPSHNANVQLEEPQFRIGHETYASFDMGGVVEFYPSSRIVTRVDLGDTIIRYGDYREPAQVVCPLCCPCITQLFERPPETRHNLQFSAGVGFRF